MTESSVRFEPALCCLCRVDDSELIASGRDYDYDTVSRPARMVKCLRCGVYYLNPRPTADSLPQIYPSDYLSYGEFNRTASSLTQRALHSVYKSRASALIRHFPHDSTIRIFDVGCGEGSFLKALQEVSQTDTWEFSGCELTHEVVQQGRDKGLNILRGRFEDLDLGQERYDVVLMFHIIEHLADPMMALQKACDITAPGGLLVLETPNTGSWDARIFHKRHWFDYQFPRHWYVFNRANLTALIESAGYAELTVTRQVGPMCWLNSLRNFMSDHRLLRPLLPLVSRWNPVGLALFTVLDYGLKCFRDTSRIQVIARKARHGNTPENATPGASRVHR